MNSQINKQQRWKNVKTDCFAYISDNQSRGCFCLTELVCRKGDCKFYCPKEDANKKYLECYDERTVKSIAPNIDKYFRKLKK